MSSYDELTEQHVREYESRLHHIDESMARARQASASASVSAADRDLLARIEADRHRLAAALDELKHLPKGAAETVERAQGPRRLFETLGLELERALTSVLEQTR